MPQLFSLPDDLVQLLPKPDPEPRVWIVGGAIRDHLLERPYVDVDLAVEGEAVNLARKVANELGWDFFVLDKERGTARILRDADPPGIQRIDFSNLRGEDIIEDLKHRDFTINALALNPFDLSQLIDPTGGLGDLRSRLLRACGVGSLEEDPVRVIRAVRFATDLGLKMDSNTVGQLKAASSRIGEISTERTRDELFQVLSSDDVHAAVRLLDHLGILDFMFPIVGRNKSSDKARSEDQKSWQLALAQIREFAGLTDILKPQHDAEAAADAVWGSVALRLGRFRQQITDYLSNPLSDDRSRRSLIVFTLLLHRSANALAEEIGQAGLSGSEFPERLIRGYPLFESARRFRLSRIECDYVGKLALAFENLEGRREVDHLEDLDIHRYYRKFGAAGIGGALLHLINLLAQFSGPPSAKLWEQRLGVTRSLLEGYFERYSELIQPESILDGNVLIDELGLQPGPEVGELLIRVIEAQVTGEVKDHNSGIEFARAYLREGGAGGR